MKEKSAVYLNLGVTGSSRLIFIIFNGWDFKLNELNRAIHDAWKMDWAFVQSGAKVQSGCREILLGILRPVPEAAVPHCPCHSWLPSSGKGSAPAGSQAGLSSWPWAGSGRRLRGAVNGQLCRPAPHPPLPAPRFPRLFTNKLFRKILLCKEWCQVTCLVNCVTLDN